MALAAPVALIMVVVELVLAMAMLGKGNRNGNGHERHLIAVVELGMEMILDMKDLAEGTWELRLLNSLGQHFLVAFSHKTITTMTCTLFHVFIIHLCMLVINYLPV